MPICKMGSGEAKKVQPYQVPRAALFVTGPGVWGSAAGRAQGVVLGPYCDKQVAGHSDQTHGGPGSEDPQKELATTTGTAGV